MKLVVDLHVHTVLSGHAYSTAEETALAASGKGLEMIAFTEHGSAMAGAPLPIYFANMSVFPLSMSGVKILRGSEVNVVDHKGKLDLEDWILKRLDFVIAGLHDIVLPVGSVAANTNAMVGAMANPFVDAISHPGNPYFPIDIPEVVKAAKEYGKLLEINNNSVNVRPGSRENCVKIAELCAEAGIPVICGSDCHISFDVGNFNNALDMLEEARFPEKLVLNTSVEVLMERLNKIRKRERNFIDNK
ncbi:MAG: phosphatase [Synergistaceae bacterium]|nr:phosphatase [Synergistaceae bacterium]